MQHIIIIISSSSIIISSIIILICINELIQLQMYWLKNTYVF